MVMWFEDFASESETEWVSERRRTITETDAVIFTRLTGIIDPVFTDEIFARETLFGTRVVPGPMVMTFAMGLTDEMISGSTVAALNVNSANFVKPVRPGDTIWVRTRVVNARESASRPEVGIVTLAHTVESDASGKVQSFERTLMLRRRPPGPNTQVGAVG
jgi:acyl dehydratase